MAADGYVIELNVALCVRPRIKDFGKRCVQTGKTRLAREGFVVVFACPGDDVERLDPHRDLRRIETLRYCDSAFDGTGRLKLDLEILIKWGAVSPMRRAGNAHELPGHA